MENILPVVELIVVVAVLFGIVGIIIGFTLGLRNDRMGSDHIEILINELEEFRGAIQDLTRTLNSLTAEDKEKLRKEHPDVFHSLQRAGVIKR